MRSSQVPHAELKSKAMDLKARKNDEEMHKKRHWRRAGLSKKTTRGQSEEVAKLMSMIAATAHEVAVTTGLGPIAASTTGTTTMLGAPSVLQLLCRLQVGPLLDSPGIVVGFIPSLIPSTGTIVTSSGTAS